MRGIAVLLIGASLALTGCASMCDSSYDCEFHAFGGMRDRIDRTNGRVSSLFDPALAESAAVPPESTSTYTPKGYQDEESSGGQTGNDDGSSDTDLRDRLLDELDKLDKLPEIPKSDDALNLDSEI